MASSGVVGDYGKGAEATFPFEGIGNREVVF